MRTRRLLATVLVSAVGCGGLVGAAALAASEPTAIKDAGLYLASPSKDGSEPATPVKLRGTMAQMHPKGIAKTMLLMGHSKPTLGLQLSGEKAEVRATTGSPAFSFYLPPSQGNGMDDMMRVMSGDAPPPQARSGAEFVLIRLHPKDGGREAEVGQQKGQHTKDTLQSSSESLGNSLYRVSPKEPLPPGEYAFYWGEQGFSGIVWDFGVGQP